MKFQFLSAVFLLFIFSACAPEATTGEDVKLDQTEYDYSIVVPHSAKDELSNYFSNSADNNNPTVTNEGAALGRVLFYDTKLSINNEVSCGSCHDQSLAFADGKKLTEGFNGQLTVRNSKAITNPYFSNNLFWDGRASDVLNLTLQPVSNHIEMGMEDMDFLAKKLSNIAYYKDLFKKAYNSSEITSDKISDAMAQFLCSMTTFESKYDEGLKTNFSNFTALEKQGKQIFESSKYLCQGCHSGITFDAENQFSYYGGPQNGATNIGLPLTRDKGIDDEGRFRIPSLRNIAKTAPYMHDGRFATLEEVIDHYSKGIETQEMLDPKLKSGNQAKKFNISDDEKAALVAFMKTLTDEKFLTDPKYSNPFL